MPQILNHVERGHSNFTAVVAPVNYVYITAASQSVIQYGTWCTDVIT